MAKVAVLRGGKYAPGCWLICRERADGTVSIYDEANTVLCQSDWDWPSLASNTGYVPCDCGATDGTIDCEHRTASDMIALAYDWLDDHEGERFNDPGYFSEEE